MHISRVFDSAQFYAWVHRFECVVVDLPHGFHVTPKALNLNPKP